MSDCIFCKIVAKEIPATIVYEDDHSLAFLDIRPIQAGHTLVIPKIHSENLLSTSDETLVHIVHVLKKVAGAVTSATGVEAFNLNMNNGSAAGQDVFHAHFHIIPRFPGAFGEWHRGTYGDGEAEAIATKIKSAFV